jgi:hypothetical protein
MRPTRRAPSRTCVSPNTIAYRRNTDAARTGVMPTLLPLPQ